MGSEIGTTTKKKKKGEVLNLPMIPHSYAPASTSWQARLSTVLVFFVFLGVIVYGAACRTQADGVRGGLLIPKKRVFVVDIEHVAQLSGGD